MKKSLILRGAAVFVLALVLVLAACEDAKITNKVGAPKVTATPVTGGVYFSWAPIKDAAGYQIWRTADKKSPPIEVGTASTENANEDGLIEFWDIASSTNKLEGNKEYTYTIYSHAAYGVEDMGKWEKKVKTKDVPSKGSEAAAPTVSLAIDFGETKSFTITVTPPASGNIPNGYWIAFVKDGNWNYGQYLEKNISPDPNNPSKPIVWTEITGKDEYTGNYTQKNLYKLLDSPNGEYVVQVNAKIGNDPIYYKETPVSQKKKVDPLFGGNGTISVYLNLYTDPATPTAREYAHLLGEINLAQIIAIPGVTYTIERTTLDEFYNEGTFSPITVYTYTQNATTNVYTFTSVSLTLDVLGHFPATTVYDKDLPLAKKTYVYRIKATKDGVSEYAKDELQIIPNATPTLSITKAVVGTNDVFTFAPNIYYAGILESTDKLVVYYKVSSKYSDFWTSPYAAGVTFTQAEIDVKSPISKTLTLASDTDYSKYLYIQVYLEKADGTKISINIYNGNSSVISNDAQRYDNDKNIYAYQLNY